jgi:hypothetical protein
MPRILALGVLAAVAYSHRTIDGGIGHNLPQQVPEAFADAVLEVGGAA